ncbi:MAG: hypothetical protein FJ290_25435 [Planctomycetes bacterium]|nr:hypothetical protein [Planctomycetota bacterium]
MARPAVLPGAAGVVCAECFKELAGHEALPSSQHYGPLGFRLGMSLGLPKLGSPMTGLLRALDANGGSAPTPTGSQSSVGSAASLTEADIQRSMLNQQQMLQTLTNITKARHDATLGAIRSLKP